MGIATRIGQNLILQQKLSNPVVFDELSKPV